jgi:uncharacterized RDD family membrane protein YckC
VIAGLTLGIGWFIWFLFLARRGQTPAKFLLKLRVVTESGFTPRFRVTFWRYYLPNILSWITAPFGILGLLSLPFLFAFILGVLQVAAWLIPTIDALFIFGPRKKRVVDFLFKTEVVYV